ncbi:MAG: arginine deiminase-related protein, partial [Sediminibacterium sp.]
MEILMVRPFQFNFNQQTAANNFFQSNINIENANELAIAEFDAMVEQLRTHQIKVQVVQDTKDPSTPDSIFPNNWFSTHAGGTLCLYPMYAENRRAERKLSVIDFLQKNYKIENLLDLTDLEKEGKFIEGTGSMVLDHQNKISYGCLSERLDKEVFTYWCNKMQFKPICFNAVDNKGQPIYHTNVMMCMGNQFVVICLESIADEQDKQIVLESILQ